MSVTMALRYLLDENLRGPLRRALWHHNKRSAFVLDVVCVGDPSDLPLGTADDIILLWAENAGRILVSLDFHTLPGHLTNHLQGGHHSPGIFVIRASSTLQQVADFLAAAAYASDPAEWQDRIEYIG
jgi:hypothetical protein